MASNTTPGDANLGAEASPHTSSMPKQHRGVGRAVGLLALILYALSATWDVATDDSAEFQRLAPRMQRLHPPGYPLLMLQGGFVADTAEQLYALQPGDSRPLVTVGIFSLFFGALAAGLLASTLSRTTGSWMAGAASGLTLTVAHTPWMQASLPEAYAGLAAALVSLLYLVTVAERSPALAGRCLVASAWVCGVMTGQHLTIALAGPVLALCYWIAFPISRRPLIIVGCVVAGAAGVALQVVTLWLRYKTLADCGLATPDEGTLRFSAWWFAGGPSQELFGAFTLKSLLKRSALALGYACYQVPSPASLLMLGGLFRSLSVRCFPWRALLLGWIATYTIYALNFDSSDVYVFYVPVYVAMAALVGLGWARFAERRGRNAKIALLALIALMPPTIYSLMPAITRKAGLNLSANKGPDYYFWPPKRGWFAAWNAQCEALMTVIPAGGAVLTEWSQYHMIALWKESRQRDDVTVTNGDREAEWPSLASQMLHRFDPLVLTAGVTSPIRKDASLGGWWFLMIEQSDLDELVNHYWERLDQMRQARGLEPSKHLRFYGSRGVERATSLRDE